MRKKILFIITKATWGGAQRYVYDLATSLPRSEFEPLVACGKLGKLVNDLISAGIKGRHLPSLNRDIGIISDIKSFFEIRDCIRELRPDVVHLNSSKAAVLGVLAARLEGIQNIIFTVHGWPFKERRNVFMRSLIYLVSWLTALLSKKIIVVSYEDERLGKRMWGVKKKIERIALGVTSPKILPPGDAYKSMFGTLPPAKIQNDTLRIVTIAELTRNKGIRYAIGAIEILTERGIDTVYVIAGEGEARSELEALARELGVNDRVFFPGFIANASQYLSGFDVFVLPSIKEGTPYVLFEAALAGLPSVTTSVIDAELVDEIGSLRVVPPKDPDALAEAITAVSKLPHIGSKQKNVFDLSVMVSRHVALYLPAGRQVD